MNNFSIILTITGSKIYYSIDLSRSATDISVSLMDLCIYYVMSMFYTRLFT